MNVQLAANPGTSRLSPPTAEPSLPSAQALLAQSFPSAATQLPLSSDEQHKWFATAVFYVMAGWIIINSGWSTESLGYPLMLIGLLLPVVPGVVRYRATREFERAQAAEALKQAEGKKRVGRGVVYELNSRDYASIG